MSRHPAVRAAYDAGTYTDDRGTEWRRGMDGWFTDTGDAICVTRHHDMAAMIEREAASTRLDPGTVGVSITAGHLVPTDQPVHPRIGKGFSMGHAADLTIHITPVMAAQWIQQLQTITEKSK